MWYPHKHAFVGTYSKPPSHSGRITPESSRSYGTDVAADRRADEGVQEKLPCPIVRVNAHVRMWHTQSFVSSTRALLPLFTHALVCAMK